jgi:hypothetical protein
MVRMPDKIRSKSELTVQWANALVEAIDSLRHMTAAYPLQVSHDSAGVRLSLASRLSWEVAELTEDLASGSSAQGRLLRYDGSQWVDAGNEPIAMVDPLGTFEGRIGDRAIVAFHPQSNQWLVVNLQC